VSTSSRNDVTSHRVRAAGQQKSDKDQRSDEIYRGRTGQIGQEETFLAVENSDVMVMESVGQKDDNNLTSTSDTLYCIRNLLETRLRSDARLCHETDRNQQMMNEWMIAAAVIDRFCFIIFSLCFIIGTALLFVLATCIEH